MNWESVIVAAISTGGALGLYALGARVTKRFGLPTDIESKLIGQLRDLNSSLEANNLRLKGEVAAREAAQAECAERLREAEERLDVAERRIFRLLMKEGIPPDAG